MTDPIDPLRRVDPPRRRADENARGHAQKPGTALVAIESEEAPGGTAAGTPPPGRRGGFAAFAAQLLGQGGQKRGLRGGKPVLDAARSAYLESEYAGPLDRRIPKGRVKKDV